MSLAEYKIFFLRFITRVIVSSRYFWDSGFYELKSEIHDLLAWGLKFMAPRPRRTHGPCSLTSWATSPHLPLWHPSVTNMHSPLSNDKLVSYHILNNEHVSFHFSPCSFSTNTSLALIIFHNMIIICHNNSNQFFAQPLSLLIQDYTVFIPSGEFRDP